MKRNRQRGVLYCPGFEMAEIEFRDDLAAIAKEQADIDRENRRKCAELGRIIAEDFERERQQMLAEALRKRAEDLLDIKFMELDEKMQSAIEADRTEARKVFAAYAQRLQKAFHVNAEDQAKWLAWANGRVKAIQQDINRSAVRTERNLLLERGIVKGRRR